MSDGFDTLSQLTLFAEAFPVSRIPLLADVADLPTSATSGPSSPESFAQLDPDGSWRKTCEGFSQVTLDGSLERFSETWPRAGMTRNGIAYQRPPSAPLTDAIASGLWPTPDANCGERFGTLKRGPRASGAKRHVSINDAARMWPTPCAEDAKNVPYQKGKRGKRYPMLLGAVSPSRMWATPTARDFRSPGTPDRLERARRESSRGQPLTEEVGGQLNPTWVEWLMGYPLGWTDCGDSGTRSSRKSRSGSPNGSKQPRPKTSNARGEAVTRD
jgi:hypothetical protein